MEYNKRTYLLTRFHTDYPQYAKLDYDQMMNFIQSSGQLRLWLANVKQELGYLREAPDWFTKAGVSAQDWTTLYKPTFERVNKVRKEYTQNVKSISDKYQQDLTAEAKKRDNLLAPLFSDAIIEIASLTHDDLPINKLFEARSKSVESIDNKVSEKTAFLNEQLDLFKQKLFEIYLQDPKNFNVRNHTQGLKL